MLRTPFDLFEVPVPGLAVPDLQVVVDAGHGHVLPEPRTLDQRGGESDPALPVELGLRSAGEEVAHDQAPFAAERVDLSEAPLDETLPVGAGVRVEAAVQAPRDDDAVLERRPEL